MMKKILFLCMFAVLLLFATQSFAQELKYIPLEPLPGVDQSGSGQSLQSVLNFAFQTLFTIGGFIAMLSLILGGIAYMTSEVAHKKEGAKKRIIGALWGLSLLTLSWLILNTINPNLLRFNFSSQSLSNPQQPQPTATATPCSEPQTQGGGGPMQVTLTSGAWAFSASSQCATQLTSNGTQVQLQNTQRGIAILIVDTARNPISTYASDINVFQNDCVSARGKVETVGGQSQTLYLCRKV